MCVLFVWIGFGWQRSTRRPIVVEHGLAGGTRDAIVIEVSMLMVAARCDWLWAHVAGNGRKGERGTGIESTNIY